MYGEDSEEYKKSKSLNVLFRKGFIVNALIAILWTVLIILPFEPFSLLLRIIVGGGPGIWFLVAYILYIIIGPLLFIGFSYLYYLAEEVWRTETSNMFSVAGFYLLFIGANITLIVLAVAGAVGGYYLNIIHAPIESVRGILEPFVNPLRVLTLVTIIGALLCLAPILRRVARSRLL
ncbi:MAG: hypothetical protein QW724_06745 [Nitrososphaerota archaeon]